jgi:hypothetical protein
MKIISCEVNNNNNNNNNPYCKGTFLRNPYIHFAETRGSAEHRLGTTCLDCQFKHTSQMGLVVLCAFSMSIALIT